MPPSRRPERPAEPTDPGRTADPVRSDRTLGFLLGSTHRALRSAWEASLSDLALTAPQAALLRAVADQPRSGLRELGRHLRTDAMNAKRLADGLEDAELVRSHTDPSHRQRRCLELTDRGRGVDATVRERARAWELELEARLGRARLAELRSLLADLDHALAESLR